MQLAAEYAFLAPLSRVGCLDFPIVCPWLREPLIGENSGKNPSTSERPLVARLLSGRAPPARDR